MKLSNKFSVAILLILVLTGCSLIRPSQTKKAEKKQKKIEQQSRGEYEKAVSQHYNNQSDATKKMMKQSKKKAAKLNSPKLRSGKTKKNCGF